MKKLTKQYIRLFIFMASVISVVAHADAVPNYEQYSSRNSDNVLNKIEDMILLTRPKTATTGEDKDLFILKEHQLFYWKMTPTVAYTNNAFSQSEKKADVYSKVKLAAGLSTIVDHKYKLDLNVNYTNTKYETYSELDYDHYGIDSSVSRYIGSTLFGLGYQYNKYREHELGAKLLSSNTISGFAVYTKPISDKANLYIQGSVAYIKSSPGDYDNISVVLSPMVHYKLTNEISFMGSTWVSIKDYDEYFTGFFNKTRVDETIGFGLKVDYRPKNHKWLSVTADIKYTDNDSTIDTLDYNSFETMGLVKLEARF